MKPQNSRTLLLLIGVFAVVYSVISLVNHYNFRTYAMDLGAYTNALYDYIHFRLNDSTVFKENAENLLADHFDLYLIIFSPISLIFKTYTLLLVQLFFILFGGLGIYRYFEYTDKTRNFALIATAYFYVFFGVISAVSFDYHSNVVAAALVPWFFYYLRKKQLAVSAILLILILISKENTALWLTFICGGLAFEFRKDPYVRNFTLLASVLSFSYFIVVTTILMPMLANNNTYPHFHYTVLGNNMSEALFHVIKNPVDSFIVLFTNHNNQPYGDFVKLELHIFLLFTGLPLLFFKPQYFFMLIPVYFQKLFHDNQFMWGIGAQYSIEFAPIMAIGIFSVISEFQGKMLSKAASLIVLITSIGVTVRAMDRTFYYTDKSKVRIYQAKHYVREYDVTEVHKELAKIPGTAVVSAQSPFLPHLSYRDRIYQFPVIKDADYIIYSQLESSYPVEKVVFDSTTLALESSADWKEIFRNDDGFVILKRSDLK